MPSEKANTVYLLCGIAVLFLIEQFMLSIINQPLKKLTLIIYPSIFFWIAIVVGIWVRKRLILKTRSLVKVAFIAVIVFWSLSFALIPLYLPVTAFKIESSATDSFQIFRLTSVSLHRAGWTLIMLILFWIMQDQKE